MFSTIAIVIGTLFYGIFLLLAYSLCCAAKRDVCIEQMQS